MIFQGLARSTLGRRIVALMILGNVALALVATGIQLFYSYERGKDEVQSTFQTVEASFRDSLGVALWKFDFEQVETLIRGINAKNDVLYLKLVAESGHAWQRGDVSAEADAERSVTLSFRHQDGRVAEVGRLIVGLSYQNLRRRIAEQLTALILSNFVKTLLASLVMLLIFDRLVARHLRAISTQISGADLLDESRIVLDRGVLRGTDELGQISQALNTAKAGVASAYRELSTAHTELKDANREQSEFTYAISHDLKSPTNTIQMLLEEISSAERERLTEDGKILIADAQRTAARMRKLIDDVLSYARTVGAETEFERIDLDQIISGILEDLDAEISASGARIIVEPLPSLRANAVQMRLLFQNLISNAIKFVKAGEQPEITIALAQIPGRDQIAITVADRGIGIPEEFQARVFGMFQKLHSDEVYPGSGLGLTLCARIVSNHGGKLSVQSRPNVGSVFTIVLRERSDDREDQTPVADR